MDIGGCCGAQLRSLSVESDVAKHRRNGKLRRKFARFVSKFVRRTGAAPDDEAILFGFDACDLFEIGKPNFDGEDRGWGGRIRQDVSASACVGEMWRFD